ncbi:MAG: signal recognition particle-docking protein FtsY [Eubacteriales bacterium]|nr:signal recognition particle-docking protein FtsY [Eubacteriales bacterium]MDD4323561.1 signal recognition particle-docking protein FtsY [Eubacteriales bacterium]MDD4541560.1 signal recognition particle-docking protein FtsY [Eubacteriales bacterium]
MAIFDKFKKGLSKTRDFISNQINRVAAEFGSFDEDMLDELEMTLVAADCGLPAATEAIDSIREHIRLTGDASRGTVIRVLREKLLSMLDEKKLSVPAGELSIFLMVGVNGTGKTTTAAKLANRYKAEGRRVMMAAADTFRAAAIEQLKEWGERTDTPVISHETGSDPAAVVYDAIQSAKARKTELLIVDTAGRLHTKKNLMDELAKIKRVIQREAADAKVETLLVLDATTGQNAIVQARSYNEAIEVSGLVISKLDGNAKGGVAIAVSRETGLPLALAGLGEQVDDLQDFDKQLFVDALLPIE